MLYISLPLSEYYILWARCHGMTLQMLPNIISVGVFHWEEQGGQVHVFQF
jgi:hypothetical protein